MSKLKTPEPTTQIARYKRISATPPARRDPTTRGVPTVQAARLMVALMHGDTTGTTDDVARLLGVYRSTAHRLLYRLWAAGVLVRAEVERQDRVPLTWVYSIAPRSEKITQKSKKGSAAR